jgi:two-component system nitrate/nitrite sensor histidine kinase NarX
MAHQVAPALYGHYVLDRLRTRAQAVERGRIARELHDGITQSLLGLEMQMAVLRRRALTEAPQLDEDLARIHGILRNEIVSLRELMEGLRVGDAETGDIVGDLTEMVERFRRYTGILAQFVSDGSGFSVPTTTRREIARIVHEALVNVRKHSGARRVLVRVGADNGNWKLSIEDDGRGFPFAGRQSQSELDARRLGPRTIGERVRRIGGEMTIVSRPGSGARVEVEIPVQPEAS